MYHQSILNKKLENYIYLTATFRKWIKQFTIEIEKEIVDQSRSLTGQHVKPLLDSDEGIRVRKRLRKDNRMIDIHNRVIHSKKDIESYILDFDEDSFKTYRKDVRTESKLRDKIITICDNEEFYWSSGNSDFKYPKLNLYFNLELGEHIEIKNDRDILRLLIGMGIVEHLNNLVINVSGYPNVEQIAKVLISLKLLKSKDVKTIAPQIRDLISDVGTINKNLDWVNTKLKELKLIK
jgi:hypothetical protein